jgi:hypothetical protein
MTVTQLAAELNCDKMATTSGHMNTALIQSWMLLFAGCLHTEHSPLTVTLLVLSVCSLTWITATLFLLCWSVCSLTWISTRTDHAMLIILFPGSLQ